MQMNVFYGHYPTSPVTLAKFYDRTANELCHLFAFASSLADHDTMYLKESAAQADRDKFVEAMVKEVEDHATRGHWRKGIFRRSRWHKLRWKKT